MQPTELSNASYELERKQLLDYIQESFNDTTFWEVAKEVYRFQLKYNLLFKKYVTSLHRKGHSQDFHFLPIQFFKTHSVKTGKWDCEKVFSSSGTTSGTHSKHFIRSFDAYLKNCELIFQNTYGNLADWCFLCLLPSYLERKGSSLVAMCDHFIKKSKYEESGFFLFDQDQLFKRVCQCEKESIPTLLIGVSYALLDFAMDFSFESLKFVKVMKTGGMKGKRKELALVELDNILKRKLGQHEIHSEYGMTECMSQLYSKETKGFEQNNRLRAVITDISDPFQVMGNNERGRVNLVDLANIDSCSFIATDDIGFIDQDDRLHLLGRLDHSDLRGCNLLI